MSASLARSPSRPLAEDDPEVTSKAHAHGRKPAPQPKDVSERTALPSIGPERALLDGAHPTGHTQALEPSEGPVLPSRMPPMSSAHVIPRRLPSGEAEVVVREEVVPVVRARWLALDLLRFAAVVLMVQGHVFYEVVDASVRNASWYGWHGYIHGFTAPIFLFSSGMAFGVTTLGKWKDHTHFGRPVFKRFERYAILLALGYMLQMGELGLQYLLALPPERYQRVTAVNALQLIGVTLAVAEGLVLLSRRQRPYLITLAVLMLVVVFVAPWTYAMSLEGWPVSIAAYVTAATRSLFPIFPWAGFLLAGVLTARFVRYRRSYVASGLRQLVVPLTVIAALLIGVGKLVPLTGFDPFPEHNFWKASPWFFFFRVGVVIALLAVLCAIDLLLAKVRAADGRGVRLLQKIGAETLVIYVAHLLVIYGVVGLPGLKDRFHHALSLGPAVALVLAVFIAMVALGWLWYETKRRHPVFFDRSRYLVTAALIVLFLVR